MADYLDGDTKFVGLPLEVLHLILDHTTKRELKALRLTNKFLHKLTTPLLFASFNVYPHVRSLKYLVNAAKSPEIGLHIHDVTFDARWIGVTDMILRRLHSVWTITLTDEERRSILKHAYRLNRQSLSPDEAFDETAVQSYLDEALPDLHNLQRIKVWDAVNEYNYGMENTVLPSFYAQLARETCGKSEHTRLERGTRPNLHFQASYVRVLLMSLRRLKSPLTSLAMDRVLADNLLMSTEDLSRHAAFWKPSFAGLKSLEITMKWAFPLENIAILNLQTLLRPAVNLEELSIDLESGPYEGFCGPNMRTPDHDGDVCESVFLAQSAHSESEEIPARLTWSDKLRKLCLKNAVLTPHEIHTILKQSAATLRVLELDSLILRPNKIPGGRACLVHLFKWMQKQLQLEEVRFEGWFTNGGLQHWDLSADKSDQQKGLLGKVHNYVLSGGPNPLEHVAIAPDYFDVHQKTYNRCVPESLLEATCSGDETFRMKYADGCEDRDSSDEDLDSSLSDSDNSLGDMDDEDGSMNFEQFLATTDSDYLHDFSVPPLLPLAVHFGPETGSPNSDGDDLEQDVGMPGSV